MKIVIATNNAHKVEEIKAILKEISDIEDVMTCKEAGITLPEVDENGTTLKENSALKANSIKDLTDYTILADDTGLFCEGLDGFPGIKTARFAKTFPSYDDAMTELYNRLDGKSHVARFICHITLITPDKKELHFEGEMKGQIVAPVKNLNAFGYDPCFLADGFDKVVALLPHETKNKISHRYNALENMVKGLKNTSRN